MKPTLTPFAPLRTLAKVVVLYGLAYAAVTFALKATAQPVLQAPAGTAPTANWVQGRAGGGPVTTGSTFTQYAYPTLSQLPFKANPGTALQFTGIGVAAGLTLAGQPAAGGIIGGTLGAMGGQIEKTSRAAELLPTISERSVGSLAPVVNVFGGGAIGGGRINRPVPQ